MTVEDELQRIATELRGQLASVGPPNPPRPPRRFPVKWTAAAFGMTVAVWYMLGAIAAVVTGGALLGITVWLGRLMLEGDRSADSADEALRQERLAVFTSRLRYIERQIAQVTTSPQDPRDG